MENPLEHNNEQEEREKAEDRFRLFCEVLYDIEKEEAPIDLNQGSGPFMAPVSTLEFTEDGHYFFKQGTTMRSILDKYQALDSTLKDLKKEYFNLLTPESRELAEKLILRAEIYLAGHVPDQKDNKKSIDIDPFNP